MTAIWCVLFVDEVLRLRPVLPFTFFARAGVCVACCACRKALATLLPIPHRLYWFKYPPQEVWSAACHRFPFVLDRKNDRGPASLDLQICSLCKCLGDGFNLLCILIFSLFL